MNQLRREQLSVDGLRKAKEHKQTTFITTSMIYVAMIASIVNRKGKGDDFLSLEIPLQLRRPSPKLERENKRCRDTWVSK